MVDLMVAWLDYSMVVRTEVLLDIEKGVWMVAQLGTKKEFSMVVQ
jgi:hypothetical protein